MTFAPANHLVNADGTLSARMIMLAAHDLAKREHARYLLWCSQAKYPDGHPLCRVPSPYSKFLGFAMSRTRDRARMMQRAATRKIAA